MYLNKGKKDDEEGQLQRGISTRQSKGTKKPYYLPCFKDPPEKKGGALERVTVKCLTLCSKLDQCSQERELCFKSFKFKKRARDG